MNKKYDAILVFDEPINESDRIKPGVSNGFGSPGNYIDVDDPRHYTSNALGRTMSQAIGNLGYGYTGNVTDFGKWIVVNIGYHSYMTGRTCDKTFLIVFNNDKKYSSVVMSSSTKWRTITSSGEAISYIRQVASQLAGEANRRL